MNFLDTLNEVDTPTKSGEYGTYTQDEAKKALDKIKGLTKEEKAILWHSVNPNWKTNPYK